MTPPLGEQKGSTIVPDDDLKDDDVAGIKEGMDLNKYTEQKPMQIFRGE